MNTTYIVIIVAFLFLIFLWIAVAVRHLKLLKKNLDISWEFVDEKIRKRHDSLPILIETVRSKFGSRANDPQLSGLIEKLTKARDEARRIYFASGEKTEKEYDLSKLICEIIKSGKENEIVSKDTYFLELKKGFGDLSSDIENRSKDYNEVVRKFNKHKKIFLLMPLALVLRLKQALIFEFEK